MDTSRTPAPTSPRTSLGVGRWTVLVEGARPGWANMARDAAMLDLADRTGAALLRLYRWQPFCLSFGRHEPAARRYGQERIAKLGIECVRRPTGGRAVWHARELTYAVAAPLDAFGGLREAYRQIHATLAAALERLGALPLLAPPSSLLPPHAGACFAAPVGGEVLLHGRKAVGSAQVRQNNAFLQHGSLLLEDDQSVVSELGGSRAGPGSEITLTEALGRPVKFDEAAMAVRAEWVEWMGDEPAFETASVPLEGLTEHHTERFRDPSWTWAR